MGIREYQEPKKRPHINLWVGYPNLIGLLKWGPRVSLFTFHRLDEIFTKAWGSRSCPVGLLTKRRLYDILCNSTS